MDLAASIVTYRVNAEHADELTAQVQRQLLPAARHCAGYRGFLLLGQADGARLALLFFDSVEHVRAAQQVLSPIGEAYTAALMAEPAIGALGTVLIADGAFAPSA
jgi:hypothetical protein